MKKVNILITHVSYQACAGSIIKLLRNSQKYSFNIIGCDAIEKGYSSGSMLVDRFYCVLTKDPINYIKEINNIVSIEKIDLIFSAEEEDLILFKRHKIQHALYEYIPEISIFELFRDKYYATQEINKKGISVPKNIMNYNEFLLSNSNTFIKRKRVSCSSRGITILDRHEILENYEFYSTEYITQEFVRGKMYTIDVLCDKEGSPHLIIPRRTLASKDGTTFKCIIENIKELRDICKKIYSIYRIPGLSNIQFIVADKPYFIEMNPRSAATMIASALSSVNIMDLYISHFLLNEDLPVYNEIMKSVKWDSVVSRYYEETILFQGDE